MESVEQDLFLLFEIGRDVEPTIGDSDQAPVSGQSVFIKHDVAQESSGAESRLLIEHGA